MNFVHLTEKISRKCEIRVLCTSGDWEIQDVALIDNRQTHYNNSTLYFGYDNQIQHGQPMPPQCILGSNSLPGDNLGCSLPVSLPFQNAALVESSSLFSIFNQARTYIESNRSRGLYEELKALADETHSLESVLNAAAIRLGNSLVFNDMTFKIIANSTSIPVIDPLWKENIRQGYCSYDFISAVKELEPLKNAAMTLDAVEVTCPESPYRKLSCKVFHGGMQIGFVLMIEGETMFMPSHREMLGTVSQALSYTVGRYVPDLYQGPSPYQQLLYDMLIGAPSGDILPRLDKMAFPDSMYVLFVRPTQYMGRRHLKEYTARNLKSLLPGTHVTYHKNGIAAVVPAEKGPDIEQRSFELLTKFTREEHVRLGISNVFSNIESFVTHYEQAYAALELGQRFTPGQEVCRYLDYQVFDLFTAVSSPDSLGRFCHPALAQLRQYDHKNNTQLYKTLCVFLDCGGSIKLTSQQLYIHRNSLVYRLNRICEVCQIDLEDVDTCFLLRLSYFIDQYNGLRGF